MGVYNHINTIHGIEINAEEFETEDEERLAAYLESKGLELNQETDSYYKDLVYYNPSPFEVLIDWVEDGEPRPATDLRVEFIGDSNWETTRYILGGGPYVYYNDAWLQPLRVFPNPDHAPYLSPEALQVINEVIEVLFPEDPPALDWYLVTSRG